MNYRDISCSSCSEVALTVREDAPADELEGLSCDCLSCGDRGSVVIREGEGAMMAEFVVAPAVKPIVYTISQRFGEEPFPPDLEAASEQVKAERERQESLPVGWYIPGISRYLTTNARHAKRCAGWPSGEWQGLKEGGEQVDQSRGVVMTPEEKEAQRRSFAYGNCNIDNPSITREDIDHAAEGIRQ